MSRNPDSLTALLEEVRSMLNHSGCRFVFSIVGVVAISCAVSGADEKPAGGATILSFDGTKAGQVRDDNGLKLKLV